MYVRYWTMRYLKIYPGPYHPHQDQLTPIDLRAVASGHASIPRLTIKDKRSIPQYIKKDRRFLKTGQRPILNVEKNNEDMKYLRRNRPRGLSIDDMWKQQHLVRGKNSQERLPPSQERSELKYPGGPMDPKFYGHKNEKHSLKPKKAGVKPETKEL